MATRTLPTPHAPQSGRSTWAVLVAIAAAWLAASCGPTGAPSTDTSSGTPNRLKVVCTTAMIGDMVSYIGTEMVDVTVLMGPGVDPHLYRPTRTDIAAIMEADIVFYNGLMLEGKMTDTLVRAASGGRTVWPVTELIPQDRIIEPEGAEGHSDPHVWMDPSTWVLCVDVVRDKLIERAPQHSDALAARARDYAASIQTLDKYAADAMATIPEPQRLLITSHDAFNYFGRRYNLEVRGIQGLSTESEAGVRDVEALINLVADRRIPAVFVETTVSDRNIKALIDGAAARGHDVTIGGSLFSDAMGAPGTYEGTYLGMIDHNVTTVVRALGGAAPERGWSNQLAQPEEPAP